MKKQGKGTYGVEKKNRKLLDVLADERMEAALEKNEEYQEALRRQEEAVERMEKEKSGGGWETMADHAVPAVNHYGAVYGAAVYQQGSRMG